jgi:long-chain acyl-CoA synthetase
MKNPYSLLAYRARISPNEVAYSDGRESLNYIQLHTLCVKASEQFAAAGIKRGDKVYLLVPEHVAFILTMALFHRGCISCVGLPGTNRPEGLGFSWTLSAAPDNTHLNSTIKIDSAWFSSVNSMPGKSSIYDYSDNSECRIILTSGTTGGSKAIALTPQKIEIRLRRNHLIWSSQKGNEINLMGLATIGGFMSTIQNIEAGRTVLLPNTSKSLLSMIQDFYVVSLIAAPAGLVLFINEPFVKPSLLTGIREIRLAGSVISPQLIDRLYKTFKAKIYGVYGSTEIGAVGMVPLTSIKEAHKTAIIQPDVVVEIVNEDNKKLKDGSEGIVRIQGEGMASSYLNDPEATDLAFRGGWFYPGDIGVLTDGILSLTGRTADVINLGGLKIHPSSIEQVIRDLSGIDDVTAFSVENLNGRTSVAFAYTAAESIDFSTYRAKLLERLNPAYIPEHYFHLTQLPRNQMGKVLRRQLTERFSIEVQQRQRTAIKAGQ